MTEQQRQSNRQGGAPASPNVTPNFNNYLIQDGEEQKSAASQE